MSDFLNQMPETPIIIIERDNEADTTIQIDTGGKSPQWRSWLLAAATVTVLLLAAAAAFMWWKYYYRIGVPISVTPSENIEKLKAPVTHQTPEVVLTSDSILGVALDFYELKGLHASIEFTTPTLNDTTIYLYSRCADYTPKGKYIGSMVAGGVDLQTDRSRLGYMAMANGQMVIGISRSDKVKDYVVEQGGSFFRQFILVSDGVIPPRFYLHGKVERRAIGRFNDTLYYIATRHKETLWDFADALREYGFIDAIYVTGGNAPGFYRDINNVTHEIGDSTFIECTDSITTTKPAIPWLVFRPIR